MYDITVAVNVHSTTPEPLFFTDLDYSDLSMIPERRIWIAIIINFMRDYELVVSEISKVSNDGQWPNIKRKWELERKFKKLISWLGTQDFRDVCDYADFSASRVRRKLKEINLKHNLNREILCN